MKDDALVIYKDVDKFQFGKYYLHGHNDAKNYFDISLPWSRQ